MMVCCKLRWLQNKQSNPKTFLIVRTTKRSMRIILNELNVQRMLRKGLSFVVLWRVDRTGLNWTLMLMLLDLLRSQIMSQLSSTAPHSPPPAAWAQQTISLYQIIFLHIIFIIFQARPVLCCVVVNAQSSCVPGSYCDWGAMSLLNYSRRLLLST